MNLINPRKLLHSKWTAVSPEKRDKHFLVTDVEVDESGEVTGCQIEAVLTKRKTSIDWHELKNPDNWLFGWK